jgi:hypothetical protein
LLTVVSVAYGLDGSWQLTRVNQKYGSINNGLTFQFGRNVDSNGNINSKLFVYDCFISQFLYKVENNSISFNFQTSSLLTDNCSINDINQLRSLIQKVFYFDISYDQLFLQSLNRDIIFSLTRQKIDYSKIMVGAWLVFNDQQKANYPVRINGTNINLCQDQGQFRYSVQTTNGTYPQFQMSLLVNSSCQDLDFLNSFSRGSFFQVASNRTQLTFFDRNQKYLFTMNQIGTIKAN